MLLPKVAHTVVLCSILTAPVLSALTAGQCTFPDGSTRNEFVPCDPSAEVSSCCAQGDACLNNGLCYGSSGVPYRGGCAGGWGDEEACPSICPSTEATPWANLYSCGNGNFFCGEGTICDVSDVDEEENDVTMPQGFILSNLTQSTNAMGISRIAGSTDGTSQPTIAASTASGDNTKHHCAADRTLPIALAIGVPLTIISLILGLWVLIERQKRMMLDKGHRAPSVHFDVAQSRSQSRSQSRVGSRAPSQAGSLGSPGWAGRNFTESDVTIYGVDERLEAWSRGRDGGLDSPRRKENRVRRSAERNTRSVHLTRSEPDMRDERRERRGRSRRSESGRRSEDRLVETEVEWDRQISGRGDLTFELPVRRPPPTEDSAV